MRVLFILAEFPTLSETFIVDQIVGLADRGAEISIWALRKGEDLKAQAKTAPFQLIDRTVYLGYPRNHISLAAKLFLCICRLGFKAPVRVLKTLSPWRPGEMKERAKALYWADAIDRKRPEVDVILCNYGHLALHFAWIHAWLPSSAKLVAVFHGYDASVFVRRFGPRIYGPLFRTADLVLSTSQALAETIRGLGCPPGKLIIQYLGVRISDFEPAAERPRVNNDLVFLFVGRLVEKKGVEYAIRAAAKLKERKDWRLLIIGDGPLRSQLEHLASALAISERVQFLGSRSHAEVRQALKQAHVLIQPSVMASDGDVESSPTVIKEAMANGMTAISTRHSGIPELVEDGATGFLVPERAVEPLARCMERFMDDPSSIAVMGRRARDRAERHFNHEILTDELLKVLISC